MPDGFIDLTVTSPPYDNLRTYKGYEFPFEDIANEMFRVTKQGGIVVWVVGDATIDGSETLTSCKQKIFFRENCGFNVHDTMIYLKDSIPFPQEKRYNQIFEYMFILSKGIPKNFNPIKRKNEWAKVVKKMSHRQMNGDLKQSHLGYRDESNCGNVWQYGTGFAKSSCDRDAFAHPAIFPEHLASDHIYSWSNEGDLIYDPFGGSGTTAKMAHCLKRKWIMSEISAEYCEIARKRLEPYLCQQHLI